jgi:hypothetical protein
LTSIDLSLARGYCCRKRWDPNVRRERRHRYVRSHLDVAAAREKTDAGKYSVVMTSTSGSSPRDILDVERKDGEGRQHERRGKWMIDVESEQDR